MNIRFTVIDTYHFSISSEDKHLTINQFVTKYYDQLMVSIYGNIDFTKILICDQYVIDPNQTIELFVAFVKIKSSNRFLYSKKSKILEYESVFKNSYAFASSSKNQKQIKLKIEHYKVVFQK